MTPPPHSDDITQVILDDHEWFRREFARLDELRADRVADPAELSEVWDPLAAKLDTHAVAEEEIFYPQLLRRADPDGEETLDAIGDHNDIRDGVHEAARRPVGTPEWWQGVDAAREANDEHMGEEENEGLHDFRMNAEPELRQKLGREFRAFEADHAGARGLDVSDKDPEEYVAAERADAGRTPDGDGPPAGDGSLGIGDLRGR